jgi:hypothetical protein
MDEVIEQVQVVDALPRAVDPLQFAVACVGFAVGW